MHKAVYSLSGTLKTLTPLHVGSGDFCRISTVKGKDGANEAPDVAAIVRDARKKPYLPSTTLKGVLRRLLEGAFGIRDRGMLELVGTINEGDGQGRKGALIVRGGRSLQLPAVPEAPYVAGTSQDELGEGVFVHARTSIDRASGTAADNKLFFQEMVAPGATFSFDVSIETQGPDAEAFAVDHAIRLFTAIDLMAQPDGFAIGKGQADGFGLVRLDPQSVKLTKRVMAPDGTFETKSADKLWSDRTVTSVKTASDQARLRLRCDGPFIVIDSSRKPKKGERDEDSKDPQIVAQQFRQGLPMLLGSSISGALRSRARWLAALEAHRSATAGGIDPEGHIYRKKDGLASLSSVQRLFGVTGFHGLLSIRSIVVSQAKPWDVTSVKIDRFSGAPVDNALFKTRTFLGTELEFVLEVSDRVAPGSMEKEADLKLFQLLLADIAENGLSLGHGVNKGFGWFRLEENKA